MALNQSFVLELNDQPPRKAIKTFQYNTNQFPEHKDKPKPVTVAVCDW